MKQAASGMSIASLILGILSVLLCCLGLGGLLGLIGFILGLIVLIGKKGGTGLAITGVITSIVGILLSLLVIIGILNTPLESSSGTNSDSSKFTVQSDAQKDDLNASSSKTVESTDASIEYTVYSIDEMFSDLRDNALKAKDKYNKQYVQITGELSVIDSDGKYISLLPTEDEFAIIGIQCYIKTEDQKNRVMEMSVGDSVTLKGKIKSVGEVLGYSLDIDEIE